MFFNILCKSEHLKCSLPYLRHEQSNWLHLYMSSVLFHSLSYLEISYNIICYADLHEGRMRCINVTFQRKTQNKLQYVAELVTKMQVKIGSQADLRF